MDKYIKKYIGGKTSFISYLIIKLLEKNNKEAEINEKNNVLIIARFCGTSQYSATGK